jgi:hypothetical protein
MQVVAAGEHRFLRLDLEADFVATLAKQAGFEYRIEDNKRSLCVDLLAPGRQAPLLLFDAADPGNLGWFSRCQFYVDGKTGTVLQTPISLANQKDRAGNTLPYSVRLHALPSPGSPTGSPKSSPKYANSPYPKIGQRLAGYVGHPETILSTPANFPEPEPAR